MIHFELLVLKVYADCNSIKVRVVLFFTFQIDILIMAHDLLLLRSAMARIS